jgi:hypothetical protein
MQAMSTLHPTMPTWLMGISYMQWNIMNMPLNITPSITLSITQSILITQTISNLKPKADVNIDICFFMYSRFLEADQNSD